MPLPPDPASGPAEQAVQENQLTQALGRLFAVAEAYPVLRASENFQQLQAELTNTEDRIAAGRRFYNANVRELNTKVETFPPNIIAGMFHFERAEYFEVEEPSVRAAPEVSFCRPDSIRSCTESRISVGRNGKPPRRPAAWTRTGPGTSAARPRCRRRRRCPSGRRP